MNKITAQTRKSWALDDAGCVCEGRLCHGKVNLTDLFQGVRKSAGRWESCVVSRAIRVDMCSVSHDDTPRGDSNTFGDTEEEVYVRAPEEVGWMPGEGADRCLVLWVQCNLCDAVYKSIRQVYTHGRAMRNAHTGMSHSGNYVSRFWSVRCTPLICLWIYQRPVKRVSHRDEASPPHSCVIFTCQRRHKSATFSLLRFLRGKTRPIDVISTIQKCYFAHKSNPQPKDIQFTNVEHPKKKN